MKKRLLIYQHSHDYLTNHLNDKLIELNLKIFLLNQKQALFI